MIRLALIGCLDDTARYARIAPRLRGGRFTAVVDGDAKIAQSTAVALNAPIWSVSLDALLAEHSSTFDAVIIRLTDQMISPLCQRAAAAGKHILAGVGPLAASVGSLRKELLPACQSAGVRLMVGQTLRFLASIGAVKGTLDAGRIGQPGLLRIHHWGPPEPGSDQQDAGHLLYRLTREIDVACWLFDEHPSEVYAAKRGPRRERPDYVQLHLGFPRGGMALIDFARTLPPGDSYFSLCLIGSAGAAYADDHHNTQLLFSGGHPAGLLTEQGDSHMLAELQEFIAAIEQGREPSVNGNDALRAHQVALAAGWSIAEGRVFCWDGERYTNPDFAATQVDS